MKKNADRFVTAIFCDDIRQEVGEKVSLMGCYQGELLVEAMPAMLAKLCVFLTVSTPIGRPIKKLSIRVMQDETELAAMETHAESMAKARPPADENSTRIMANMAMMFSPFAIATSAVVRILVTTEEGEMLGPRLRIKTVADHAASLSGKTDATPTKAIISKQQARKTPAKKPASRRTPSK